MTYHRYSARNGGSINLANLERREDEIGSERRSKRKLTCTKMSSITAARLDGVGNRQTRNAVKTRTKTGWRILRISLLLT